MLVTYTGKKTAYYNGRSYRPNEVFEAPNEIPKRDMHGNPVLDSKGFPVTVPLKVYPEAPFSKLRKATEVEYAEYVRSNPDYARRRESEIIIEKQQKEASRFSKRAANPALADA